MSLNCPPTAIADEEKVTNVGNYLLNTGNPLKGRFRALFTLKNINTPLAIQLIGECFQDSSDLLKHELAYCLGQMQSADAIPILEFALKNQKHPMVRHEAAEALGAIGTDECLEILKQYKNDKTVEVAETVELALARISEIKKQGSAVEVPNPYHSVDPAFPLKGCKDVELLEKILLDEKLTLYQRYQAMFALRNIGTEEATEALGKGLKARSALFRHEIAFVLGQLQKKESTEVLAANLKDLKENEMVRHECAEALGAIGTAEAEQILKEYIKDRVRVVRESCEVALDICEYEMGDDFQYANSLNKVIVQ